MKKIIILFILLIVYFIWNFWFWIEYEYFYSDWCVHCHKVNDFMEKNDWFEKLWVKKHEVMKDWNNALLMNSYIENLWLNPQNVWVPFLIIIDWEEKKSIMWDVPIIDFFKEKLWVQYDQNSNYQNQNWSNTTFIDLSWQNWNKSTIKIVIFIWIIIILIVWISLWLIYSKNK